MGAVDVDRGCGRVAGFAHGRPVASNRPPVAIFPGMLETRTEKARVKRDGSTGIRHHV